MKNSLALTTKEFIDRAKNILIAMYIYNRVYYINNKTNVDIICPEHGIFQMRPSNHLAGQGCYKCSLGAKRTLNDLVLV